MPKMIFVNLPVADVEKSAAFYEAAGFARDERFSRRGSAAAMTCRRMSQSANSRHEVSLAAKALRIGVGTLPTIPAGSIDRRF